MEKFTPIVGAVYRLCEHGDYRCEKVLSQGKAVMERVSDGWNLVAHGIVQNADGTIDWDYYTGGHWSGGET